MQASLMPHFNSIKVRLEPGSRFRLRHYLRHFNSIKVRLERTTKGYLLITYRFQFHKGTIRTSPILLDAEGAEFQFHKGTIRTPRLPLVAHRNARISIP